MRLSCCAAALLLAFSPQALPATHANHERDRRAEASVPALAVNSAPAEYRSAFSNYRGFNAEEPLVDWRAANEEVGNSGGHVGLMRASKKPSGNRAAPEAAGKPEMPKGHH